MLPSARTTCKRIGLAAGLLAVLIPAAGAHAQCALLCEDDPSPVVAAVVILAPEAGVSVPTSRPSAARFVLGWSWQIPFDPEARHRFVPSFDLPLDGAPWAARVGYRYGGRQVFVGAGFGGEGSRASLSPEVGVKFAHFAHTVAPADPSLHLLVRAEIGPESRQRDVTIRLGWNLV